MSFILRADGERFVVPAYREVITRTSDAQLKQKVFELSHGYGELVVLQARNKGIYDLALSSESGYLLGETVWQYFKKPANLIYCEAIPNSSEAILVIVKEGSVYLDGTFLLEAIPDEFLVFLAQEDQFSIFVHGDVPISQTEEEGKFHFDAALIESFTLLEQSAFSALPLLKQYQLVTVERALTNLGVGVFPYKKAVIALAIVAFLIGGLIQLVSWFTKEKEIVVKPPPPNPYLGYYQAMSSPAPSEQLSVLMMKIPLLFVMPGWDVKEINFSGGTMQAKVASGGSNINTLQNWANHHDGQVSVNERGVTVSFSQPIAAREKPDKIYAIKEVMVRLSDKIALIYPGNHVLIDKPTNKGAYSVLSIKINIKDVTPAMLGTMGKICQNLPLVLNSISLNVDTVGLVSGTISLDILGS